MQRPRGSGLRRMIPVSRHQIGDLPHDLLRRVIGVLQERPASRNHCGPRFRHLAHSPEQLGHAHGLILLVKALVGRRRSPQFLGESLARIPVHSHRASGFKQPSGEYRNQRSQIVYRNAVRKLELRRIGLRQRSGSRPCAGLAQCRASPRGCGQAWRTAPLRARARAGSISVGWPPIAEDLLVAHRSIGLQKARL
jgi:hypothetical protein